MALKKITLNNKNFDISYEIINPQKDKDIIFLHGWGANKELLKSFFYDKFIDFRHIYIDMPGFGNSTNKYILNSFDYKDILNIFLNSLDIKKDIIMGHSFGGKIATLLEPNILVLLSSAGIVESKPLNVKIKIILAKLAKKFNIKLEFLKSKDSNNLSKNMYETFKNVVDEDFSDIFKNFNNKAIIFWGKQDKAVNISSGRKIYNFIKNSIFYELQGDHYFYFQHSNFIEKKVLCNI